MSNRRPKTADPDCRSEIETGPAAAAHGPWKTRPAPSPLRGDTFHIRARQAAAKAPGSFRRRLPGGIVGQPAHDRPLPVTIFFPLQPVIDRRQCDMRLAESRRLAHERFKRLAGLV